MAECENWMCFELKMEISELQWISPMLSPLLCVKLEFFAHFKVTNCQHTKKRI
jgi:hypothetical protein